MFNYLRSRDKKVETMKRHAYSKLIFCILLFLLIALVILLNDASGDTIIVAKDGNGDHDNIKDAIDNAKTGDTIQVWEGTYTENIEVNRTVTIIGNGTGNTSINGNDVGNAVNITANGVSMRGFTVTNGKGAGIRVASDSNYLYNIKCEKNNGAGIDIHSSINTTVTNCVISNNTWAGISLNSTSPVDDSGIQKVTNNTYTDSNPVISGNNVVWSANSEIFFWDGTDITQITDNSYMDYSPQISGNNVVWLGLVDSDFEIFFWDGTTTTQITDNTYYDYAPQISGNNVVWYANIDGVYEIFFWDGTTTTRVTDNNYFDYNPQISGDNVVWYRSVDGDYEIFFWNGTDIIQITDNDYHDMSPLISGNNVVWRAENEIFFWDGKSLTQVTDNNYSDTNPQLSGNNVAWVAYVDSNYEIFFWNGTSITRITDNVDMDYNPYISGNNVVWYGTDGNDFEIYLWDGISTTQITDNDKNDQAPRISGSNVVWSGHDGNDDEIFFWSAVEVPTRNLVTHCYIVDNGRYGVYIDDVEGNTQVHSCSIDDNGEFGAYNEGAHYADISGNWWGDPAGPGGQGPGTGDNVTDHVDYTPWLNSGADQSPEPGFQPDLAYIHVDDNSPQTSSVGRIQEGIDMVVGCTVYVHAGTYTRYVVIDKKIDLIGEGMENTTIDGNGSTYSVRITVNWVNMSNFGVTNGMYGISILGANNVSIENVNCSENLDIGFYLQNAEDNEISGCIASNNVRGIFLQNSDANSITHCDVTHNSDAHGIILSGSNDNIISSCNVLMNEEAGITLWSSNNNVIFSNTISHNTDYGIYLSYCTDNNIHNNTLNSITSQWGFFFTSATSYDNNVKDNKINDFTYYHYYNIQRTEADPLIIENLDIQGHKMSNIGNIFLGLCENVTLRNIRVTNNSARSGDNGKGLYLYSCHNMLVENITASDNYYGIYCNPSTNITFSEINAYSNDIGIYLLDSENCTIEKSTLLDNSDEGIYLNGANNNDITDCTISQNWCGIYLKDSRGNTILSCNVSGNSDYGIFIDFSQQNIISSNDISMNNEYGILLDGGSADNNINNNTLDSGASQWGFFFENEYCYDNDVKDNTINGYTYYHYYDIQGTESDPFVIENLDIRGHKMSNIGNIFLGKCENVTLRNIMVTNNSESSGGDVGKGVYLYSCHNVRTENITASGNYYGIYCNPSTNITFSTINASSNEYGIYIEDSDHFEVKDCTIQDNTNFGVFLQNADWNTFTGCTVSGNNMGIYLSNAHYNTISECTVSGNSNVGIYLTYSDKNNITSNTISWNERGILLSSCTENTIRDNTLNNTESQWGLFFAGTSSYDNEVVNNKINGYTYYHYYKIKRTEADPLIIENLDVQGHMMSNIGNVFVGECENVTLRNISVGNNSDGIGLYIFSCNNVTVTNATAWKNKFGILINPSTHINLDQVNASGNSYGIMLSESSNCTISDSRISNNQYDGIDLDDSRFNTIADSRISNNQLNGIYLDNSRYNTITGSVIINNNNYGLYFEYYSWKPESSDNNTIYNNHFDNTRNVYDKGNSNIWNISKTMGFNIMGGYNLGGNYWNDYTGDDTDADAIGDTDVPYDTWMTNGADHLPLVDITILEHDIAVTILESPDSQEINTTIMINTTITNFGYSDEENITIEFVVDGVVNQTMTIDLSSLSYTSVSFNWTTPMVDGDYELKISAKTETADNRTGNDLRTQSIDVFVITDIEVTDISWSPLDPDDGETVHIETTILNNHTLGTTRTIQTTLYLDDVVIYSKSIDGLAAGESVNLSTTWIGGPGNHILRVFTDSLYTIRETNETNNNLTGNLNIPFPDLVLTDLSYSPEVLDDGDVVTFSATIENQGSTTIRTFYAGFYIDDIYIGRKRVDGLSKSQVVNITQVWPASPGNHTVKCIVDYRTEVTESNETNNERSLNITGIRVPDLTIINVTWTPSSFSDGSYVQFNATIKNIGDGNTSRSYYAGFKVDGVCVGKLVITGLDAGETRNYTVTWRATAGLHTLMACVDPDNDVTESNETNNNHTSVLPLVPAPDLIVTSINCSKNDLVDGTVVTFNATVKNTGTGNTSMNYKVTLFLDEEVLQTMVVNGLNINDIKIIEFTQPWTTTYGDHNIRTWVDDSNWITESNETNNNMTIIIVVNDTHPPGLSSIDPVNNSFVKGATNITILLTDMNGSGVDLDNCTVEVKHQDTVVPGTAAVVDQTIVFTPDSSFSEGEHEVTIDGIDMKKNSGRIVSYFTIDTRPPEIEITGILNDTTYDHPVTPSIEVTELYISYITIRVNGHPFINGTTITSEGTYVLYVKAVDKAGNVNESTMVFRIDKKPSPPTGLHVQRDDAEANISWDQNFESDIQRYNVYRDGEMINDQLVTGLYYLDADLDENETYVFNVTAVDIQGQESEKAGIHLIGITLVDYGTLVNDEPFLTRKFADTITVDIVNDDDTEVDIDSVTIDVLNTIGEATSTETESSFSIPASSTYQIQGDLFTGSDTTYLRVRVLTGTTEITRIFTINVRDPPGDPVGLSLPVLLEGYTSLIDIEFTNYGSAPLGVDPSEVTIDLWYNDEYILSHGGGLGSEIWIEGQMTGTLPGVLITPMAIGEDIHLENLSLEFGFPTYWGAGRETGTIYTFTENVSSEYITVPPITLYYDEISKGTNAMFNPLFVNQGDANLTVHSGDVTVSIYDENESLLSQGSYDLVNITVRAGCSHQFPVEVFIPADAPDQILVRVELKGSSDSETANTSMARFILDALAYTFDLPYNANASTDKALYQCGETVMISGLVTDVNGTAVPNATISLSIISKGFTRDLWILADGNGSYSYLFKPLINEAGSYQISATHPYATSMENDTYFGILGLYIVPPPATHYADYVPPYHLATSQNGDRDLVVYIENRGESILTGIDITIDDIDPGDDVTALFSVTTFDLLPGQRRAIEITVIADETDADNATFTIQAACDQGGANDFTLFIKLYPDAPVINLSQSRIQIGMESGKLQVHSIVIGNEGYGNLENVIVMSPSFNWITIVSNIYVGNIQPDSSVSIDVHIAPPEDLTEGLYEDRIIINSTNYEDITIPIQVTITSEQTGNLKFIVKNYLDELLPDAEITLTHQKSYKIFTGETDDNGEAIFENIAIGRYTYTVSPFDHYDSYGDSLVQPGITIEETVISYPAFLKYEWVVTPTTIEDVYDIEHIIIYNSSAPIPYIKMDRTSLDIYMIPGTVYYGNVTLTNMNDIVSVFDVEPFIGISDEFLTIEFMIDNIPELRPRESVTVPYIIKLAEHHSNAPDPCEDLTLSINIAAAPECVNGVWVFPSADTQAISVNLFCWSMGASILECTAVLLMGKLGKTLDKIKGLITAPLTVYRCAGTVRGCLAGEHCGDMGSVMDCALALYDCISTFIGFTDIALPPGSCVKAVTDGIQCFFRDQCCGFGDPAIPTGEPGDGTGCGPGGCPIYPYIPEKYEGGEPSISWCRMSPEMMCILAKVKIQQEQILERQAFDASLTLENTIKAYDITDVSVVINITDMDGNNCNDLFFVNLTRLKGVRNDDNGVIAVGENGTYQWLIIPTPGAGGSSPDGERYTIQALVNYTVKGVHFSFITYPEQIVVKPMPALSLDYMLPRTVYGDDPMTEGIIEEPEPFMWGVRVRNSGYGAAMNLRIESSQPEIVNITKGAHISFELLGTYLNGDEIGNSLNIPFGNIAPGGYATAGWIMECSLTGNFTNYTVTFTHRDELGGNATSLLVNITTHVLIREFINDLPGSDNMFDFLIDTDNDTIPDYIIDSQGNDRSIGNTTAEMEGNPTLEDPTVTVTIDKPEDGEWIYVAVDDPLDNTFNIRKVVRNSDGKVLNKHNYWLREGMIHMVDDPSEIYTVFYNFESLIEPEITNILALPDPQEIDGSVNITCLVIDNIEVNVVKVNITMPDGSSVNVTMDGYHYYNTTYDQLGIYQYYIWANDTDDNYVISPVQTFTIIETVPPTTTISMGEPKYWNGTQWWVHSDTPFNLSAEDNPDGYGVDATYYRIWNDSAWGDWMEYTGNFTLPGEGLHHIEYYSIDLGGIIEEKNNHSVLVDVTQPSTVIALGTPYFSDDGEHWITTDTPISLLASDLPVLGSGINETWYKIEEGEWTSYNGTFMIPEECNHTISFYSMDYLGNTESQKQITVHVDNTSSSSTLEFGGPYFTDGEDHWIMSETQIYLNATDEPECKSGVNETWYKIEDGEWASYVDPFSIVDECNHTISYYSSDNLENTEIQKQIMVSVDNTAPITTIEFSDPFYTDGEDSWITTTSVIYLNATDGPECRSGVKETWYKVEDGEWTLYTGPFSIPEECEHTISYYSVDNLGITEIQKQVTIQVDHSAPTTTIEFSAPYYTDGEDLWITTTTVISLSATDDPDCRSGVAETWYKIEDSDWILYTEPFSIPEECEHIITYYSIDNLGNAEIEQEILVSVDQSPPNTSYGFGEPSYSDGETKIVIKSETPIYLTATDSQLCKSGVNATWYKVDDGEWILYTEPFSILEECDHNISYYSNDNLGNTEIVLTFSVLVDNTPPSTSISFGQPYHEDSTGHRIDQTTLINLTATDISVCQSGVKEILYMIDDGQWELYSGPFTIPDELDHSVSFYSKDNVGNIEAVSTILTRPYSDLPDLEIKSEVINLSTLEPIEDKDFTIFVEIANVGKEEAKDIDVQVFDGTDLITKVTIESLAGGDTTTLEIEHSRLKGTTTIRVVIDPDKAIFEFDEDNNEASRSFIVLEEEEEEEKSSLVYVIISIPIILVILIILFFVFFKKPVQTSEPSRKMVPVKEETEEEKDDEQEEIEGNVQEKEEIPKKKTDDVESRENGKSVKDVNGTVMEKDPEKIYTTGADELEKDTGNVNGGQANGGNGSGNVSGEVQVPDTEGLNKKMKEMFFEDGNDIEKGKKEL